MSVVPDSSSSILDRIKGSLFLCDQNKGDTVTEMELASDLGVSRGAIREALVLLEQQGLIERKKRKGTTLRIPGLKELADLWDTRCALESMAIRLACAHVTEADIQYLRDCLAKRREASQTSSRYEIDKIDIEFHQRIIDVSRNTVIRDLIRNNHLFDRVFRIPYRVPSYWQRDEDLGYGHEKIIDALEDRDADLAEKRLREHIMSAKKRRIESSAGISTPY
jgi:DNA-binding GntR family transcriptional regulator